MEAVSEQSPPSSRDVGWLELSRRRGGAPQILAPTGELDLASRDDLALAVEAAEATDADFIVLDLLQLEFIDSSGVHVIVDARGRLRQRLIVVAGPPCVDRVFELDQLVQTVACVAEWPSDVAAEAAPAPPAGGEARPAARARREQRPSGSRRRASHAALAGAVRELRSPPAETA